MPRHEVIPFHKVDEPNAYYREKIEGFTRYAEPGAVLDYGCGQGHYSHSLAARGWQVVGIDMSSDRVEEAAKRAADIGLTEWCRFVTQPASGEPLPFDDASFDNVFASEVIEHVPDPLGWIREIKRVLRAGGVFHLTTPNGISYRHVTKNLLWHLRGGHQRRATVIESWPRYAPGKEGHIVTYEFETLYRWANLNGFSLVAVDFTEKHRWWRRFSSVARPLTPLRTGLVLTLRHEQPELLYA
jgi:ubiquinone/menaquinone biosynthesis C-methylase UbiE